MTLALLRRQSPFDGSLSTADGRAGREQQARAVDRRIGTMIASAAADDGQSLQVTAGDDDDEFECSADTECGFDCSHDAAAADVDDDEADDECGECGWNCDHKSCLRIGDVTESYCRLEC